MKIVAALRSGENATNTRAIGLLEGAEALGHKVVRVERSEVVKGVDLLVQVGFNATRSLRSAIDERIPYLIMEAPPFRTLHHYSQYSSFGYNGLAGGAWRPLPLEEPRPRPVLEENRGEGTIIIGQKPTDHSLRGSDHVQWLQDRLEEFPDATFRPHPLMLNDWEHSDVEDALRQHAHAVVYTSSTAVEAGALGLDVRVDGQGCWWNPEEERREQLHRLSYAGYSHAELATTGVVEYILGGYGEALDRMERGLCEVPRPKVNGGAVCDNYYRRLQEPLAERT